MLVDAQGNRIGPIPNERLTESDYDDSPWTREELEALAWEAGKPLGWEDMDEYDDVLKKPSS